MEGLHHSQKYENNRYADRDDLSTKSTTITPNAYNFSKRGTDSDIQCRKIESPVLSVFDTNIIESGRQPSNDSHPGGKRLTKCHSGIVEFSSAKHKLNGLKEKKAKAGNKETKRKIKKPSKPQQEVKTSIDAKTAKKSTKKTKKQTKPEIGRIKKKPKIKIDAKRSKSAEAFRKTRKVRRLKQDEANDVPGDIISLSIVPDTMEHKTGIAKSCMSYPLSNDDDEKIIEEVLSNSDLQIQTDATPLIHENKDSTLTKKFTESIVKPLKSAKKKTIKKSKINSNRIKTTEK